MPVTASILDRLVARARAVLAWEVFWRAISGAGAVAALFLAFSWFGLWGYTPPLARPLVLLAFLGFGIAVLWSEVRRARLDRLAALKRIDRDSGDIHGVARALTDEPANAGADPATAALWRLHRARLAAKLGRVEIAPPSPRAVERDRYALRAGAVLLAIAAGAFAGSDRTARVKNAFAWSAPPALVAGSRIDAWIDPPPYTGRPPIVLTGQNAAEGGKDGGKKVAAPVGSAIVARASDAALLDVKAEGGVAEQPAETTAKPPREKDVARRFVLKGDGKLVLGRETFEIAAIPDAPPSIELLEQPKANLRGTLSLSYKIDDDYGVVAAEARFAQPEIDGRPAQGKPLVEAPKPPLGLPPGANGLGEGQTTADMIEHPWAGARVTMTLHARDEGGNEGASAPLSIYLPQRPFTKPMAKALVEQRRNLVLEPERRTRVLTALRALMLEPDRFGTGAGVYLGLRTAANRLQNARTDDGLREVADYLWSMALQIEDGGLSDAEKELRAAEQQLRDALQRNASEEEIRKLTENLRAAMDKFLAEMAQRMQNQPRDQAERQPNGRTRTITPDQLKNMLDQLEQAARSGDMAEAQRLLDQLQNMMENLRTAQRRSPQDRARQEMNRQLGEMDKLMRDQQQLRDDTYRDGRRRPDRQGQRRPDPSGEQNADKNLRQRQQQLRDKLGEIQRQLGRQGGGEMQKDLDAAREAMKEADGDLGEGGDRDKAVDAQGRALDAMKKGADQLARQMQGQPSEQAGDGEGPQMGEADGEERDEADPLGRPSARDPKHNPRAKYDPLGQSPALRAQRVLEELRRRLGDVARPQEELDYLERLLRRY